MTFAEQQFADAESDWRTSDDGSIEEARATFRMIDALRGMVAELQKQVDELSEKVPS